MPRYRLRVPTRVAELLRRMHPELKRKLRVSLRIIAEDAGAGKALGAELEGLRSYRVGGLRIIYKVRPRSEVIEIIAIGPRSRIYEETLRLVRQDSSETEP